MRHKIRSFYSRLQCVASLWKRIVLTWNVLSVLLFHVLMYAMDCHTTSIFGTLLITWGILGCHNKWDTINRKGNLRCFFVRNKMTNFIHDGTVWISAELALDSSSQLKRRIMTISLEEKCWPAKIKGKHPSVGLLEHASSTSEWVDFIWVTEHKRIIQKAVEVEKMNGTYGKNMASTFAAQICLQITCNSAGTVIRDKKLELEKKRKNKEYGSPHITASVSPSSTLFVIHWDPWLLCGLNTAYLAIPN